VQIFSKNRQGQTCEPTRWMTDHAHDGYVRGQMRQSLALYAERYLVGRHQRHGPSIALTAARLVAHRTLYFTPTLCLAQTVRACPRVACPNGLIDTLNPRSVQRASGQLRHVRVCLCGLRRWSTCDTRQKALAAEIARHPPSVPRAGTARFGAGPRTARPEPVRHRAGSRRGYQRCGMVLHGVLVRDIQRERAVSPPTASRAFGQSKRASKNDLKANLEYNGRLCSDFVPDVRILQLTISIRCPCPRSQPRAAPLHCTTGPAFGPDYLASA
jgi:hypothetical protein